LIYVVDDDALLLDFAEAALRSAGYRTRKFVDPEAALQTLQKSRIRPTLLISDYAMGRMNGLELIEQCKAQAPGLKTFLISGTAGAEILLGAPVRVDQFLAKPYQAESLVQAVGRILAD
jgi:DNA-binding NtrC family response regulator